MAQPDREREERRQNDAEAALRRANLELSRREGRQGPNRRLTAESEQLRRMFEQGPGFMAVARSPDYDFTLANMRREPDRGCNPACRLPTETEGKDKNRAVPCFGLGYSRRRTRVAMPR